MASSSLGRVWFALTALIFWAAPPLRAVALDFPGPAPGPAQAHVNDKSIVLENNVLRASWKIADGHLRPDVFLNKLSGEKLEWKGEELFRATFARSPRPPETIKSSEMRLCTKPRTDAFKGHKAAGGRPLVPGRIVSALFESASPDIYVAWQAALCNGANYVRQEYGFVAPDKKLTAMEILPAVVLEVRVSGCRTEGIVDGSPITTNTMFLGGDHPLAKNVLAQSSERPSENTVRCVETPMPSIDPNATVLQEASDSESPNFSTVFGVAPPGQMRRAFLYYLEAERAAPYHPFLHYNNGAEIGCEYWRLSKQHKFQEAAEFRSRQEKLWTDLIHTFGRELVEKRGAKIDSFVHDHGWDDPSLVWQFHAGYPHGFTPARDAAARYDSLPGVWFSPWGGYEAKKERIEAGLAQGFEVNRAGLSLAGPRYNARLSTACENMIHLYGVNYFKFDGFAGGINKPGPEPYTSDVEALLLLCTKLRERNPNVFINATTGSWPSPFWLRWVDSIWRQGQDTNVGGKGSDRQRWITYRDGQILHGTLERAPLFPLSSLMIHGIYVNKLPLFNPYDPKAKPPTHDPTDITQEIRSFFGTGVNCQEMYINPELMTPALWDVLAEGAKWSRANSDVLVDTHWVGGDPLKGEIYGFASWQPRKGILTLRNPNDQPGRITLDVGQVFELPAGAATHFALKSPWKSDAAVSPRQAQAGQPLEFALQPFEVLVFEAVPK